MNEIYRNKVLAFDWITGLTFGLEFPSGESLGDNYWAENDVYQETKFAVELSLGIVRVLFWIYDSDVKESD